MVKISLHPKHPERVCWGCNKYCPADHLDCGNGTVRTQHPAELFGEDWLEWGEQHNENGYDPSADKRELEAKRELPSQSECR